MTHAERLTSRMMKLFEECTLPLPTEEEVTIILRATRPGCTSRCLEAIGKCTRERARIITVSEDTYDPESPGIDRLNLAFSQVQSNYFVMMDDSVIVTPHWLTRLLWTFYDDPGVGIASPVSNNKDDPVFYSTLDELFAFSRECAANNSGAWETVEILRGTCFVCRKSILDEIGGLDYSLQSHEARLLDWCLRAKTTGSVLALCKDAFVYTLYSMYEDQEETKSRWVRFCNKWKISETIDPYTAAGNTNEPVLIPLASEALSPPPVSVIVTSFESSLRALHKSLNSVEEQDYKNIEVLLIRQGSAPKLQKWVRKPAAGIWMHEKMQIKKVFESAWSLAKGQYVTYLEAGDEYEQDHIGRLVDRMHRRRATIGFLNTAAPDTVPISFAMHLHPKLKPVDLDFQVGKDANIHVTLSKFSPFETVTIPEQSVKRRVKV